MAGKPGLQVEVVGIVAAGAMLPLVGYLKWRAYLRYLERAAKRGELTQAAQAAALYPEREHGLANLARTLTARRQAESPDEDRLDLPKA